MEIELYCLRELISDIIETFDEDDYRIQWISERLTEIEEIT